MLNKEKLIEHIKEDNLKDVVIKVIDKAEIVLKKHEIKSTDFLNPYELSAAINVLNSIYDLSYIEVGGYKEAERKTIVMFPDYLEDYMIDIPVAILEIQSSSQFVNLDHRDYLGSILGMGLKREKIGDIIIHNNMCQIIINSNLKDYILYNLNKVGNTSVKVKEIKLEDIIPPDIEYKKIQGNIASLRLDAVLSTGFKLSRTEAQSLISKERVNVNWGKTIKSSYEINENDIISVKGKGRVIVDSIEGKTKSGRTVVKLLKPI